MAIEEQTSQNLFFWQYDGKVQGVSWDVKGLFRHLLRDLVHSRLVSLCVHPAFVKIACMYIVPFPQGLLLLHQSPDALDRHICLALPKILTKFVSVKFNVGEVWPTETDQNIC